MAEIKEQAVEHARAVGVAVAAKDVELVERTLRKTGRGCVACQSKESFFLGLAMLAKLTSKNQLTLPKAAVQAVEAAEYFEVTVREGQIVLTPVRIQRGDAVRAKLAALGLAEADVANAVQWARASRSAAPLAAEPAAGFTVGARRGAKRVASKKPARRA